MDNLNFFHLIQEMLQNICATKEKVSIHAQYIVMPPLMMMFKNGTTEYNIDDISYPSRTFVIRDGQVEVLFTAHDIRLIELESGELHIYLK